jgi:hypothetical protein
MSFFSVLSAFGLGFPKALIPELKIWSRRQSASFGGFIKTSAAEG